MIDFQICLYIHIFNSKITVTEKSHLYPDLSLKGDLQTVSFMLWNFTYRA